MTVVDYASLDARTLAGLTGLLHELYMQAQAARDDAELDAHTALLLGARGREAEASYRRVEAAQEEELAALSAWRAASEALRLARCAA